MNNGILLINKPKGITSNHTIQIIKNNFNIKKIGHCGTLDLKATGLMIVCIEKYIKIIKYLTNLNKKYIVTCKIGIKTSSNDANKNIVNIKKKIISKNILKKFINKLKGKKYQQPPMLSAIKYKGIPLYKYEKKDIFINLKKRKIYIKNIDIIKKKNNYLIFEILCSKGTYIRKIISIINKNIKTPLCINEIHRVTTGIFNITQAYDIFEILKNKSIENILLK